MSPTQSALQANGALAAADHWTTNAGAPVPDNDHSETIGTRGPVLLEDYHLLEKLAQFDRERIPERVVHARGFAAKGYFEVTDDVTRYTSADFWSEVGKRTPVIARLSTVVHPSYSSEGLRDVRGFSVKFYTNEGNYDFVGNNIPVFFVRDGMKFPDLVHALKPNPRSNIQEWWRIWDFLQHHPESCHMLTWLLDDPGIPASWRHMEGYGVHTFTLLDKNGGQTYVKFHFRPKAGVKNLSDEEAASMGGPKSLFATQDAFYAIEGGEPIEWTLFIQTMDPATDLQHDFDPLDATKIWPEDQFPLQKVGRLVLDKNVDNVFAENEQLAFNPALVVPGITYSDDKLLQSRLFSYADTQRYRIGPNYLMLPVNAPQNRYHNTHADGPMQFGIRKDEVNYFPSKVSPTPPAANRPDLMVRQQEAGDREKVIIEKTNDFQQAGDRYRNFDEDRKKRFQMRVLEKLMEPRVSPECQQTWLGFWRQCDQGLGDALSQQLAQMQGQ